MLLTVPGYHGTLDVDNRRQKSMRMKKIKQMEKNRTIISGLIKALFHQYQVDDCVPWTQFLTMKQLSICTIDLRINSSCIKVLFTLDTFLYISIVFYVGYYPQYTFIFSQLSPLYLEKKSSVSGAHCIYCIVFHFNQHHKLSSNHEIYHFLRKYWYVSAIFSNLRIYSNRRKKWFAT